MVELACAVVAAMLCDLPHSEHLIMCVFSALFVEKSALNGVITFRFLGNILKSVHPTVQPFYH